MTLLVGIRCTDGAVIAADSAVTFSAGQLRTISDTQRKITIIQDTLIVAGTGQVGLGQRFQYVVEDLWNKAKTQIANANAVQIATAITQQTILNFQQTSAPQGQYGALLAFPAANKVEICEFATGDFQPELKTSQLWYASMGSGQLIADPYLRLMRHVFWQNGPPNLQSGKFAAMWVMHHAIKAAPGGIAEPIDMAVLEMTDKGPVAKMLSDDELREHVDAVKASTEHFRDFERKLQGLDAEPDAPAIPKV